jgi:signal transduction histidine kinase
LEQSLSSLEKLLQVIERMNDLISQLLDFSRLQNKQLELYLTDGVNLVDLVQRVVEQQRTTTKSQPLIVRRNEETILARCDEARLEQVLVNLISNAMKYSNPGSPVIVGIERRVTDNGHAEAVIRVQDEGQGISEEHQAHIFDRFYRIRTQANSKVDGMGLGLYISQCIVTEHGGRMWLKSKLGAGTTFYFSLPLTRVDITLSD